MFRYSDDEQDMWDRRISERLLSSYQNHPAALDDLLPLEDTLPCFEHTGPQCAECGGSGQIRFRATPCRFRAKGVALIRGSGLLMLLWFVVVGVDVALGPDGFLGRLPSGSAGVVLPMWVLLSAVLLLSGCVLLEQSNETPPRA
jgi:hypothetical protein